MPNNITLSGEVVAKPTFSHKAHGESFYEFYLASERRSGATDVLRCVVPEILAVDAIENEKITVYGEVRTNNRFDDTGKLRLKIDVFVKAISDFEEEPQNFVELEGYVVKRAVLRATPLGRDISDLLIASQRERYPSISDYIPCIAWGRTAFRVAKYDVGEKVNVIGRLQSREYVKHYDDKEPERRTAYELSIIKIDSAEEAEGGK